MPEWGEESAPEVICVMMRPVAASRLLAVLFADLVDSTETVARLGPEAGEAWRKRFLAVMREALAGARGREVQHTGDGLFAAFDSASDAVACGVGMQQRVAQASQRRDAGALAAARVAIAAGEAREDAEGGAGAGAGGGGGGAAGAR